MVFRFTQIDSQDKFHRRKIGYCLEANISWKMHCITCGRGTLHDAARRYNRVCLFFSMLSIPASFPARKLPLSLIHRVIPCYFRDAECANVENFLLLFIFLSLSFSVGNNFSTQCWNNKVRAIQAENFIFFIIFFRV